MAIRYLKKGKSVDEKAQADAKVQDTVKGILADIAERKDAAVRDLSQSFDGWNPDDFRLSGAQIEEIVATLPEQAVDDIKFAQKQIGRFAQAQRNARSGAA